MRLTGRFPAGLIGAIVLVLAVESSLARNKREVMGDSLWSYDSTRQIAGRQVKDCGVLILGDSLISHGVSANVIRERTGLQGFNLSFPGSQAPSSYLLLREALESGAHPKFVIVDFFPKLLNTDPWFNITNLPMLASFGDCLEIGFHGRDSDVLASLVTRKALPSIRYRESLRDLIVQAFKGMESDLIAHRRTLERNRMVNRGLLIAGNRCDPNYNVDDFINWMFPPVDCTPLNRHYIDKFMNLASQHGVQVVMLLPPFMPRLQARLEERGIDAGYQAFAESLLARYPDLQVLDARKLKFETAYFIDPNHLGYEGAKLFSAEIGDFLQARMQSSPTADGRWFAMSPYQKRSIDIRHETYDESRVAVIQSLRK